MGMETGSKTYANRGEKGFILWARATVAATCPSKDFESPCLFQPFVWVENIFGNLNNF